MVTDAGPVSRTGGLIRSMSTVPAV